VHDLEKQGVREMRYVKVEEEVQKKDREGVEGYQRLACSSSIVAARRLRVWAAWQRALLGFGG
jgi:hypothetical protein